MVLKDLWTGDLVLGGEGSVGRGVLQGEEATMTLKEKTWILSQANEDSPLVLTGSGNREQLEIFATKLQGVT
jgi:hypothetical protein